MSDMREAWSNAGADDHCDNSKFCLVPNDTLFISSTLISTKYSSSSLSRSSHNATESNAKLSPHSSSSSYFSAQSNNTRMDNKNNYESPLFDGDPNLNRNNPTLLQMPSSALFSPQLLEHIGTNTSESIQAGKSSVISTYIDFVHQYRPFLHLMESSISKLFLFSTSSHPNNDPLSYSNETNSFSLMDPEVGYAILNFMTWMNNVIYYGVDKHHFGVTTPTSKPKDKESTQSNIHSTTETPSSSSIPFVFLLRTILSGLDCVQPALEQLGILQNRHGQLLNRYPPHFKSSSFSSQYPWHLKVKIEQIKCVLRMTLILLYHYRKLNKEDGSNSSCASIKFAHQGNCCGILELGGILLPGHEGEGERDLSYRQRSEESKIY